MTLSANPLVLYHASCNDGFAAAWVANKYFKGQAEFRPVQYGQEPPDVEGRKVFIVDFSYSRQQLEAMEKAAKSLTVLDHHETAERELSGLAYCVFDMNKSGGRLAWDHFFGSREDPPMLVSYTEDHDLFRFYLPFSRAIRGFLQSIPRSFQVWDSAEARLQTEFDGCAREGAAVINYQRYLVRTLVYHAREVEIGGYRVKCVNACVPGLVSDICHELALGMPFGACWFARDDGKFIYELRSTEDGINVAKVAEVFGGGGHRHAAGFTVDRIL